MIKVIFRSAIMLTECIYSCVVKTVFSNVQTLYFIWNTLSCKCVSNCLFIYFKKQNVTFRWRKPKRNCNQSCLKNNFTRREDNGILPEETSVFAPFHTETVEISWLSRLQLVSHHLCLCEQKTLNKKVFMAPRTWSTWSLLYFFFSYSDPFSQSISIHQTETVLEHDTAEAPL